MIPGGCEGVAEEVALSAQQVRMTLDPRASTSAMIAAAPDDVGAGINPNR
jgi:hypothetical protein